MKLKMKNQKQQQSNFEKSNLFYIQIILLPFRQLIMDEEILGAEEDFQMSTQNTTTDPNQRYFNRVVMCLQQVLLDQEFQSTQTLFMKQNCYLESKSQSEIQSLFNLYRSTISQLLNNNIRREIPDFDISKFGTDFKAKMGQVDLQIAEIVLSCIEIESFKTLLNDYKVADEEEERYRVLTIKTNKMPENKKVKGNSENIFGSSNVPSFVNKGMTKKTSQKAVQKSLDQLLVPQTVLTVKGLRKC